MVVSIQEGLSEAVEEFDHRPAAGTMSTSSCVEVAPLEDISSTVWETGLVPSRGKYMLRYCVLGAAFVVTRTDTAACSGSSG